MADGTKRPYSYHYGQPDALLDNGKAKIDAEHRLHSKMIGPLDSQFVFPLARIGLPLQLTRPLSGMLVPELDRFEQLAQQSTKIEFELNAVLFEDGTVLGADDTHFAEAYEAAFAGEQQVVRYIVGSFARGVSSDEVENGVVAQREEASNAMRGASNSRRVFNTAVISYADEFLNVQKTAGYEAAVAVAREHVYKSSPKLTVQRVARDQIP
jgi:hypothetical protein